MPEPNSENGGQPGLIVIKAPALIGQFV